LEHREGEVVVVVVVVVEGLGQPAMGHQQESGLDGGR